MDPVHPAVALDPDTPIQSQEESDQFGTAYDFKCLCPEMDISRSPTPELHDSGMHLISSEVALCSPDIPIPPQTFGLFPFLPPEVRLRIYELALPIGTTITRTWNNPNHRYGLRRLAPAVLQSCREARYSFMAVGPTDMRRVPFEKLSIRQHDGGVFVDWSRDSLFIRRGYNIHGVEMQAYSRLRFLAMDWGLRPCWVPGAIHEGVAFIRRFPSLQVLTLLVEFDEREWTPEHGIGRLLRLKKRETRAIAQAVRDEIEIQKDIWPHWTPPRLRVVHKTEYWRNQPVGR